MSSVSRQSDEPVISIIGGGRVGTALALLAARRGHRIAAVAARDPEHAEQAAQRIGPEVRALSAAEAAGLAELVLITTPDDSIEGVCAELAAGGGFRQGAVVAHCSGVLTSTVLASARESAGCRIASFHPLQTFPDLEAAVESLPGSHVFMEGDDEALALLGRLGERIGMRCVEIPTASKVLYHAAAVMACNHLCALMDASLALEEQAGIQRVDAWEALEPLVRATLANITRLGPEAALTGPIARGDEETLSLHLEALAGQDPRLEGMYRSLGLWACELALRSKSIAPETAARLSERLR
jgi:predicted short-subunit dehydrogenase-like oxidoreductase (DUF2520 family)